MEKIKVNEDLCIGCGMCVSKCEEYFEFNDEGHSKVKKEELDPKDKPEILDCIESCPTEAISIEE